MAKTVSRNSLYENAARSSYQNPANSGSRMPVQKFANGGRTDIAMPVGPAGRINSRPISPPRAVPRQPRTQVAMSMAMPQMSGMPPIPGPSPAATGQAGFGGMARPMPVQPINPQVGGGGFGGLVNPMGGGAMRYPQPMPQQQPQGPMIGMPNPMSGYGGLPNTPPMQPGFTMSRVPMAPMLRNPWG